MWVTHFARSKLRGYWHRQLDRPDREAADSRPDVYAALNTLIVDLVQRDPRLQPRYLFGVVHAVHLARQLGIDEIVVLEFGTGRGNGAWGKARAGDLLEEYFGVSSQVHTFDIGSGIPATHDVRDLPHQIVPGGYADFDIEAIKRRIAPAHLHVGSFIDGARAFLARPGPPIGYIELDTGTYTGAVGSLAVLREAPDDRLMPRIHCFVNGICGFTFGEHNGARLAIKEHNHAYPRRPVSQLHGLRYGYVPRRFREHEWVEGYFLVHIFDHPFYTHPDSVFRVLPTAKVDFDGNWFAASPNGNEIRSQLDTSENGSG